MEEKLIDIIQTKPFIFDKGHKLYQNRKLKENSWKEIAAELQLDVEKVKKRWISLREQFVREIKKQNQPSGSGSAKDYVKFKHFERMQFLREVYKPRRTNANLLTVNIDDDYNFLNIIEHIDLENNDSTSSVVPENVEMLSPSSADQQCRNRTTSASSHEPSPSNNGRNTTKSVDMEMLGLLKEIRHKDKEDDNDDFAHFLKNVEILMKSANFDLETKIDLQIEILNLIKNKTKELKK